jgi:hypothetical protein
MLYLTILVLRIILLLIILRFVKKIWAHVVRLLFQIQICMIVILRCVRVHLLFIQCLENSSYTTHNFATEYFSKFFAVQNPVKSCFFSSTIN